MRTQAHREQRAREDSRPQVTERSGSHRLCRHLDLGLSASKTARQLGVVMQVTRFVALGYSSPSKLITGIFVK